MATVSEKLHAGQWQKHLDPTEEVRRLSVVCATLTKGGIENMEKGALKRSISILDDSITRAVKRTQRHPEVSYSHHASLEAFAAQATQIYEQLCSDAQAASGKPNGTDAFPYIRAFLMKYKLLLSVTRKGASKPQKEPSFAEPQDYIFWATEARETLILCYGRSEGTPLCRAANKLVTAFRGIATADEYVDWTYRARKLLLEVCETLKEDATLLNSARKLVIEHKLIAACLPAGQKELREGLEFPFKEVRQ